MSSIEFLGEIPKEDGAMEMLRDDEAGAKVCVIRDRRSDLRRMSAEQLYGADGTAIAMTDEVNAAVETAAEQGLSFVPVN